MHPDDIRGQVQKIISSPVFSNSESLIRLLRATVEETLAGRSEQLKEYVLGAEVLGKGSSFDPKADPIVRIQIGRLRAKLERYYQVEGSEDPIIIDIPKGAYVPHFEQRKAPDSSRPIDHAARRRAMLAALLALIVLLAVHAILGRSHHFNTPVAIAVLPFSSPGSDPGSQYFSEGFAEEIIRRLMKIEHLRIIRWTGEVGDLQQLGQKLKVRAVLGGNVVKTGDRVRVTASLTDATEGRHQWTEVYDRELKDVLAIQEEIAGGIAASLGLPLSKAQRRSAPLNLQAFELYLQGRFLLNWKDIPTTKKAIAKFQAALALDSGYASAYAGLADCYERLMWLDAVPPIEMLPRIKEVVMEALRLDDKSAEAHTSLSNYLGHHWDFQGAERELRRAIELNPNYALARMNQGVLLSARGRHEEGLAQTRRAVQLEPLSLAAAFTLGVQLLWARRYEQSTEQLRRAAELAATIPATHSRLADVLLARGMHDEAIVEFRKALELAGGHPSARALLAHACGVSGRVMEAKALLRELIASVEHEYVAPLDLARVYLGLGERDRALDWVERAYAHPASAAWPFHLIDPMFDGLRSEPRFTAVLKKLDLQ